MTIAVQTAKRYVLGSVRRLLMPYGRWTLAGGEHIYFNRDYNPIWYWASGTAPVPIRGAQRVPWVTQRYFYTDQTFGVRIEKRLMRAMLDLHFNDTVGLAEHESWLSEPTP